MTKVEIALIICIAGALIALVLAMRGGGPRVTEITRRVEREEEPGKGE